MSDQLFDPSKLWGSVLKGLRERGEVMLHAACADMRDVEFTGEGINVYCREDAVFKLFDKKRKLFDELAGVGVIEIRHTSTDKDTEDKITHLKELFGEKLKVMVKN